MCLRIYTWGRVEMKKEELKKYIIADIIFIIAAVILILVCKYGPRNMISYVSSAFCLFFMVVTAIYLVAIDIKLHRRKRKK